MAERMTCTQCGMPCDAGEYHPFAACLMFKACGSPATVRANLTQPAQAVDVRSAVVKALGGYLERHWPDNPVSYDDMADHITRAIDNAQAEGWRDIATAPQDGTRVLLWVDQTCRAGTWRYFPADAQNPCAPTHWQPLPTPPTHPGHPQCP